MELGHRRVAAGHHLGIGLARDRGEPRCVDDRGEPVHALAPAPEVVAVVGTACLGVPGQGALEGVAVGVDQPGDHDAGHRHVGRRRGGGADRDDAAGVGLDADVAPPAVGRQRVASVEGGHRHSGRLYIQVGACYRSAVLHCNRDATTPMAEWDLLLTDARLATLAADGPPWGVIEDASLAINDGRIAWLGPREAAPAATAAPPARWRAAG
ncbi:MAG: hypothetical protein U5K76_11215 [Woeseiaceae bacterium]|nr:hypothetical protein [Woeseiaceae bacterium]